MDRSSWYIFFTIIGEVICIGIRPYKMSIVSYSAWPENAIWDISKARMIGRQRLVNGTVTLREDMDNEHYSFSGETYSDPVGDGNFKLLPFHIPQTPVCEAFKKYRSMFSKHAEYGRQTDFPNNRDICPIPKGTYYLKDITLTTDNWPAIVPRGFIRGNGSFFQNDQLVGLYSVTILIEDEVSR